MNAHIAAKIAIAGATMPTAPLSSFVVGAAVPVTCAVLAGPPEVVTDVPESVAPPGTAALTADAKAAVSSEDVFDPEIVAAITALTAGDCVKAKADVSTPCAWSELFIPLAVVAAATLFAFWTISVPASLVIVASVTAFIAKRLPPAAGWLALFVTTVV
jgi:hypothetical protein